VKIFFKFILLNIFFLSGCAASIRSHYPPKKCEDNKTIYVDSHGWHTGIIVKTKDIKGYLDDLAVDFNGANYLEIGWGDKGFYQASEITSGLTLQAMFWPTDSIAHVVGFYDDPEKEFYQSEMVKIDVSKKGLVELLKFIESSFERDSNNSFIKTKNGLYGWSKFYKANGNYHIFSTCNNWVAEGVRKTGFPISTLYAATAGNVIYQLENYSEKMVECK
jgi:uncharacterized protein (TIGR02117 family)